MLIRMSMAVTIMCMNTGMNTRDMNIRMFTANIRMNINILNPSMLRWK